MRERTWILPAAAGYVALFAVLVHQRGVAHLTLYSVSIVLFVGLVMLLRRVEASPRFVVVVILGVAAALQIAAWTAGPSTSDDVYRYLWDGHVQLVGIDPYSHPPSSPALASLRDHLLFPGGNCPHPFDGGCTLINRPTVRTVYPPAAQLAFDGVRLISFGGHGGTLPFQVLAGLGVLAVTVLLLRWRRDAPLWPAALWAWSPLVVLEYGNNAHIDWLAVLISLSALLAARRGRSATAGVLVALATLIKLYPVLLAPSLLRRRPLVLIGAAVATGVLLYLPHVIADGGDVIGYLPGYLHEEGYGSGSRLLLLGSVLPHPFDTVVAVVVLAAVAWWVFRHSDPDEPERSAVVLVGAAFLVTTPAYGWYSGLLLALCVVARRYEWVPVALAPTVVYLVRADVTHTTVPSVLVYLAAAMITAGLAWMQRGRSRSARLAATVSGGS